MNPDFLTDGKRGLFASMRANEAHANPGENLIGWPDRGKQFPVRFVFTLLEAKDAELC